MEEEQGGGACGESRGVRAVARGTPAVETGAVGIGEVAHVGELKGG
jgi:hypothetical protein